MEALEAFGVNWKLMVIQGVNFTLLLLILYKFLWKPLFAMLDLRAKKIAEGIADADAARKERENAKKEHESILASARTEGGKVVE